MRTDIPITLLTGVLSVTLLLSGCGMTAEEPVSVPSVAEQTQAPIYSNNVPMEYLVMANQSENIFAQHEHVRITVDHILYGESETWLDAGQYYHSDDNETAFVFREDPRWSAVTAAGEEDPHLEYCLTPPGDILSAGDSFRLLEASEDEVITEEAEFEGVFHVKTLRPIGEDLEFYSMLHAGKDDQIREEYLLDLATLSLLSDTTTLVHPDGSEELIGTMTVSYEEQLPMEGDLLAGMLEKALEDEDPVTLILMEDGQDDRTIAVRKGTSLEIRTDEGQGLYRDEEYEDPVQGPFKVKEDTVLYLD